MNFQPGQSGNPAGKPKTPIDVVELENLAKLHATQADMAAHFGLTKRAIEYRVADVETMYPVDNGTEELTFKEIIERGNARGRVSLRQSQFKLAIDGNATMQIWLGKQLLGQSDEQKITHAGVIDTSGNSAKESIALKLDSIARREEAQPATGYVNGSGTKGA